MWRPCLGPETLLFDSLGKWALPHHLAREETGAAGERPRRTSSEPLGQLWAIQTADGLLPQICMASKWALWGWGPRACLVQGPGHTPG